MERISQYESLLDGAEDAAMNEIIAYLKEELPSMWISKYKEYCVQYGDICSVIVNSFEYIFDDRCCVPAICYGDKIIYLEPRVIGVLGTSLRNGKKRDDYRLRGWIGKTDSYFGRKWDKGHFIAHTIGGAVDHAEINVFRQRRDLNRGWSAEGKIYRKMETYCFEHPGTFCFHRPVYTDEKAFPSICEFGVLTEEKKLWVEQFDNN